MPAAPAVDRAAWSQIVDELLASEARGNVSELARRLTVHTETVRRWLRGTVAVSEANVRQVATIFGLDLGPLLVRVGSFQASDLQTAAAAPDACAIGETITALIAAADVSPSVRREMTAYVVARRARFEEQLAADLQRILAAEQKAHRGTRTGRRHNDSPT